jgi:hypothetical protein
VALYCGPGGACKTRHGAGAPGCKDIDECSRDFASGRLELCNYFFSPPGVPGQVQSVQCVNTEGSFHCACMEGFNDEDKAANNNTGGKCLDCLDDADECQGTTDPCADFSNTRCFNTFGSFLCPCIGDPQIRRIQAEAGDAAFQCQNYVSDSGYELVPGETMWMGNCRDIDECADEGRNDCAIEAACFNTDGSFTCSCNAGWTTPAQKKRSEVDECGNYSSLVRSEKAGLTSRGLYEAIEETEANPLTGLTVSDVWMLFPRV